MRCGYNAETDCIWDTDNRVLAAPLGEVVSIIKDAAKNCEATVVPDQCITT
jgi:hypothetical protein